ncbi:DUF4878 domain-containing protein [Bacteroidales bacterium OttesenSCG-928-M11]|nr:DUF4878 domain-containing protein [Bacteroidales bacterium OttesenSCG-928-M11]
MKKYLLILCLPLLILACSNDSPRTVAESFCKEIASGNFDKARKYCTEDAETILDLIIENAPEQLLNPEFKFTFEREELGEEEATIYYTNEKNQMRSINLILVDGKWKAQPISLHI